MTKTNLNKKTVDDLPFPEKGEQTVWDAKLRGFGIRVTRGAKTYFALGRVGAKLVRYNVGSALEDNPAYRLAGDARNAAREALVDMAKGINPKATAPEPVQALTLSKAAETYFAGKTLKPRSEASVRFALKSYFADWMTKELPTITPADMLTRFRKITKDNGPGAANLGARGFRAIWSYVRKTTATGGSYTLPDCPVQIISATKSWNRLERRQTYVTDARLSDWFKALDQLTANTSDPDAQGFRDFLELLLRTGLRRSEAEGMLWTNVDMQGRTLTIPDTKNGKALTLPLSTQAMTILQRRLGATGGAGLVFAGNGTGRGRSAGQTGKLGNTRAMLNAAKEGVPFTMHDLRRTFCTLADGLGFSTFTIKRMMNHSDGDVTSGYIIHSPERLRVPMQAISDEIDRLARLT